MNYLIYIFLGLLLAIATKIIGNAILRERKEKKK
jgi:hypothetical protein